MKNKLTIMRGIPGSGKSTEADRILEDQGGSALSADLYPGLYTHDENGDIKINPHLLGAAHGECIRGAVASLMQGDSVIIDNTNLTVAECAPYVALGLAYGADVEIVGVGCDPDVAYKRQTHGVPRHVHMGMVERFKAFDPPPHWAFSITYRYMETT